VNIRDGRRSDAPRLHEIEVATFDVHQIPLRAFSRLMGKPSALTLVYERASAEGTQDILGYARVLFRQGTRSARLYSLAVTAEARNLGVGTRLLEAVIEQVREKGLQLLTLEVRSNDTSARRFYERFGFKLKDELPVYYDDGADAVRLVLALC
jgi:ribosomal protein S18 acetylase RimI-like enzyme